MRLWRDYNLSITLACLWIVSWVIQTLSGWMEYVNEQTEHGLSADLHGYVWVWLRTTFENNSSEFLQLLTMVVLTAFLIHKGSKESRDSDDRQEQKIDGIARDIRKLQMHLTRLEQVEHNRRVLAQMHADHVFDPFDPKDTSGMAICAKTNCLLPRHQHPTFVETP